MKLPLLVGERWRLRFCSRFLRTLFQFSKRAAGEAAKFGRSGVELLGVVGAARLECDEPVAEAGELIRRQLGNSFGDFFDFHVAQYSTAGASLSGGKGLEKRDRNPSHTPTRCTSQSRGHQPRPRGAEGLQSEPSADATLAFAGHGSRYWQNCCKSTSTMRGLKSHLSSNVLN
jgi:hypothetical protein